MDLSSLICTSTPHSRCVIATAFFFASANKQQPPRDSIEEDAGEAVDEKAEEICEQAQRMFDGDGFDKEDVGRMLGKPYVFGFVFE